MPITYCMDREKKLIYETWTGEIRVDDLKMYWQRYLADAEVLEIRRTIVDLRSSVIHLSWMDFDGLIKDLVLPALKGRKWTTAIVVEGPAQFGVSRQYQAFADRFSKDSIFDDVAEAEKWICSQAC